MSKMNISCLLGGKYDILNFSRIVYSQLMVFLHLAFILMVGANMISAEISPMDALTGVIHTLRKVHDVSSCLTRSCDAFAVFKTYAIEYKAEKSLEQVVRMAPTNLDLTLKCDLISKHTLTNLLALDEHCADASYSCPVQNERFIPADYVEYITGLGNTLEYSKCINLFNVQEAIDVIGNGVRTVEQDVNRSKSSVRKLAAGLDFVAKGLKNLCTH